jgi:hypothetical protein
MEQGLSWVAKSRLGIVENEICVVFKWATYCSNQEMNPVDTLKSYFKANFNISPPSTPRSSKLPFSLQVC